jgi:ribosomal protein S18 acetylase RimI-like enzyme
VESQGGFVITKASTADAAVEELSEALARLIPQLTASAPPPTREEIRAIVASPCNDLLLARETPGGRIIGALTLVTFRIPTGLRAWIEDVIVDGAWRRRGVGEALTREAVHISGERGVRSIDLTSRPARKDAQALYEKLGFARRETSVFRHPGVTGGADI